MKTTPELLRALATLQENGFYVCKQNIHRITFVRCNKGNALVRVNGAERFFMEGDSIDLKIGEFNLE